MVVIVVIIVPHSSISLLTKGKVMQAGSILPVGKHHKLSKYRSNDNNHNIN